MKPKAITERLSYVDKRLKFNWIMFNTCAAHASSGKENQYLAYCDMMGIIQSIDKSKQCLMRYGLGGETSKGMENSFSVKNIWLEFDIHIVIEDVPILICINDMDRIGVYLNKLKNTLHHPASTRNVQFSRLYGHLFLAWKPVSECHFAVGELRRLHRRFGHPLTEELENFLSRTALDETPT